LEIQAIERQIEALDKLRKAEKKKDPLEGKFKLIVPEEQSEIKQHWDDVAKAIDNVATSAEFAGGAFVDLEESSSNATNNIEKDWIDIGPLIANSVIDIASAFGDAASGAESFGDAVLKTLANFAQQFGALLIATGIAKVTFDSFSGPAMIAAGVALVAGAAAVKGAIDKRPNLSNNSGGSSRSSGAVNPFSTANGSLQDSAPKLITVIKGQDLWVMLENYQRGNMFTRAVG
jgi:hypothetical protein